MEARYTVKSIAESFDMHSSTLLRHLRNYDIPVDFMSRKKILIPESSLKLLQKKIRKQLPPLKQKACAQNT